MKPTSLHADAEVELRFALEYYEEQRAGLAGEFRAEFEAAVERVRQNPQAYVVEDESGVRYCPLRRFLYTLVYVDFEERIWVAALAHQRRRPAYWTRRRPD
jgi:toxin ParE1/3/4